MNKINKAWEEYHGHVDVEGGEPYIPSTPPLFTRGYTDGYQQAQSDLKKKIDENEVIKKQLNSRTTMTQDFIDELIIVNNIEGLPCLVLQRTYNNQLELRGSNISQFAEAFEVDINEVSADQLADLISGGVNLLLKKHLKHNNI